MATGQWQKQHSSGVWNGWEYGLAFWGGGGGARYESAERQQNCNQIACKPFGNQCRWETDFLPLLVLMRRGRSTSKNQYW